MATSGRIERADRTMFQVTVVLEVPKIGFKICLTYFFTEILISGIFHVYVKLQVRLHKAYHEAFFHGKNKKKLLIYFQPIFLMFSGGLSGFKWNIACKWV